MSAKTLANPQLNLETAGTVEETVIDHSDKIRSTTSTSLRTRSTRLMKAGIVRVVIWAAIAVLLVVMGSTAGWAQAPSCPNSPNYTPDFSSSSCLTLTGSPAGVAYPGFYLPASSQAPPEGTPNAAATAPGNVSKVLRLTTNGTFTSGSAWFTSPQTVTTSFSTTFTFQLSDTNTSTPADGFAFVIQNSSVNALDPDVGGTDGCSIGYGDDPANTGCTSTTGGIPNSLAVEFDTYQNGDDPNANHVAIQSCGQAPNSSDNLVGGVLGNPAPCNLAINTLTGMPIILADGSIHTATIFYTLTQPHAAGTCQSNPCLDVLLDGVDLFNGGVPVNLSTLLSLPNNTAWVGFTAATGGSDEISDILSWTFTNSEALTVTELGLGAGTVTETSNTSTPPPPPPINCSEAGGGLPQTGTCSESDTPEAVVTLLATAGASSTFGGWGGACASSGTAPSCTVTMSSAQNVTASFVAASLSPFELTFNQGTNVTQSALLCYGVLSFPSNPNTCSDPNASELTILIPTVNTTFSLYLQVTEFSDNGLCPTTGTVFTNYSCRFKSFFNFGTDANGNIIAPLSYPYLNGNSVQYLLYYQTPGGTIPPAFISGDLYLDLGLLNTSAASNLPSYWAGTPGGPVPEPVVLDDPDSNEFPGMPYGTNCSDAMLVNNGAPYLPTIYCQFDENITTFYNPAASLNSTGGGKIPANNNFGLVFLPTNVPIPNPSNPIPTPVAPTIGGSCVGSNGCAFNGSTITFTEGMGGTFAESVTDAAYPPAILTQSGTLPGGLTFNPVTGLISGTPADGTVGNYSISFTATNSAGAQTLAYTLTVAPAGPLTITASSATVLYGTVPVISASGSGFVNGDTLASLTKQPTCSTTATSTSLPGTYTSSCTGAVDTNYSSINYVNGTVTVVGLEISPLTVNFGSLYLDQIGAQFVTLKNTTNAPITITSMTLGGGTANGDYGSLSFCPPLILKLPATLAAGKSCVIGVGIAATANVFSPTASTTYLTIADSAATQTVLLTALVTDPQVSLSSTSLNFGNQKTGTTSLAQKVTLTNSGLTNLTLTGLTISGNFALATGTTCTNSTVLSPGAPCYIYVTFMPTTKGSKSGTVTITDHTLFGLQFIWLSGAGN